MNCLKCKTDGLQFIGRYKRIVLGEGIICDTYECSNCGWLAQENCGLDRGVIIEVADKRDIETAIYYKVCPHCGSIDTARYNDRGRRSYDITCTKCGFEFEHGHYPVDGK